MQRRDLLVAALPVPQGSDVESALRHGGVVLAFRHALAPGNFDPPGFKLGACSTQRNLSDEGRDQARRIGAWFGARQLQAARVRSSPWCRCMDTARLAFGDKTEAWAALGSPRAGTEETNAESMVLLRAALSAAALKRGSFEVWVTHNFVFSALLGESAGSGEGLLLGIDKGGGPRVLGRFTPAALARRRLAAGG